MEQLVVLWTSRDVVEDFLSWSPYLDLHHREPLAENGEDTVENAAALCPVHGEFLITRRITSGNNL